MSILKRGVLTDSLVFGLQFMEERVGSSQHPNSLNRKYTSTHCESHCHTSHCHTSHCHTITPHTITPHTATPP